jgi:GT2 family glycosyltransferase
MTDTEPASDKAMRVAVVIVNYNAGGHLNRALEHVRAQTRRPDRVVVVDNASTDGSLGSVRARFPEVRVEQLDRNLGFAAANNRAFKALATDGFTHVALLNPDAFPEPRWLEALLAAAARHPDCASFASRMMLDGDPSLVDGLGDAYHISGYCWRIGHGRPLRRGAHLEESDVFGACAGAALYDLGVVQGVGEFDDDFFCYVEDVDLAYRLRLAGFGCRLAPDAVVRHVGSASSGQRSDFSTYHGHRNVVWALVKNTPAALLWIMLPLHVLASVAAFAAAVRRGQGGIVLRAKRDALRGLPRMWRKRRDVQALRTAGIRALWSALDVVPVRG